MTLPYHLAFFLHMANLIDIATVDQSQSSDWGGFFLVCLFFFFFFFSWK